MSENQIPLFFLTFFGHSNLNKDGFKSRTFYVDVHACGILCHILHVVRLNTAPGFRSSVLRTDSLLH